MRKGLQLNLARENHRLLSLRRQHHFAHPTPAERHVKALLEQLNERHIFQKGFFTQIRFFLVDFYLPKPRKLCLEVDGGYHADQREYDEVRTAFLVRERGLRVVRITNEEALALDADALRTLISVPPGTPWQEALRET